MKELNLISPFGIPRLSVYECNKPKLESCAVFRVSYERRFIILILFTLETPK